MQDKKGEVGTFKGLLISKARQQSLGCQNYSKPSEKLSVVAQIFLLIFYCNLLTTWEISLKTLGTFSIIKKLHHQKVGADIVITIIGVSYQFKWK